MLSPIRNHRRQQVFILISARHIRFTLIPDNTRYRIIQQWGNHSIIKSYGFIMESSLSRSSRHGSAEAIFPITFQTNLRFSFFRLTFSEKYLIRFLLYKMRETAITEKTYGYRVFSSFQQSGGNGIDTWWILIRNSSHKRTIYIDGVCIYDASQAKSCLLSRLLPGHLKIFTEPMGTIDCIQSVSSPTGSKQIGRCPITVIIAGSIPRDGFMHSFISLIQCYIPGTAFLALFFFH